MRVHDVRVRSDGVTFDGVGYHHDLRPANVLVSGDTFLLADFGVGRIRDPEDGSVTRFKVFAGDYAAPECMDEEFTRLNVGRAVDAWAFGCLLCEVLTYAYLGVDELKNFRAVRKILRPSGDVRDSLFHTGSGEVKAVVRDWISFLAAREWRPEIGVPLEDLLSSLLRPVSTRPNISPVCLALAHLSLKAHFFAVLDVLSDILNGADSASGAGPRMKLWFERERLRAFGSALGLQSTTVDDAITHFAARHGDFCEKTLVKIFLRLPRGAELFVEDERIPAYALGSHDPPSSPPRGPEETEVDTGNDFMRKEVAHSIAADGFDEGASLESDIQGHVQELWSLLSAENTRKAERIWADFMLDATDSIDQLSSLEKTLGSQRPVAYQQGSALTMMKRIRLEILHNSTNPELASLEISDSGDIQVDAKPTHGHQMGVYGTETRVLIESIFYGPSWEKIPPAERTLVMTQRSIGFSPKPKPPSLRLLDCLGFFEAKRDSGQEGFSFVYQVPRLTRMCDNNGGIITLNRLLVLSAMQTNSRTNQHTSQPLLGDKFRLAGALAGFLAEFHNMGWLHENFHSNNIVYFNIPTDMERGGISPTTSTILFEPFVVGLNKSRPGGESWHTRGPADDKDFLDYRHPAYQLTQRFRVGYDYYSLGIVLLEIGLWMPVTAISRRRENSTLRPEQWRDLFVSRYVPRLGYRMGMAYRDVVHALLSDRLDPELKQATSAAEAESRVFSTFLEEVVGPLERLANGFVEY